jgi:hypothetical protein
MPGISVHRKYGYLWPRMENVAFSVACLRSIFSRSSGLLIAVMFTLAFSGNAPAQTVDTGSVGQATLDAINYFQTHQNEFAPDAYIIYHYLEAVYDLPSLLPAADFVVQLQRDSTRYAELQPFLRIIQPEPFQQRFLTPTGGLDDITAAGVWYDHLKPKKELKRRIQAMELADDYNVTHAYLALYLAQSCFHAKPPQKLWHQLQTRMDSIINRTNQPLCDVQIEAIALRQLADPTYTAPADQIERILAAQQPDGSWLYCLADKPEPNQHTTVFALWVLLGYRPMGKVQRGVLFLRVE